MSYTSGDTADADAFEAAIAGARTRTDLPPITLTGTQRQYLIDTLTASREAHQHARRATKVRFETQRHATAADAMHTALSILELPEPT